MNDDPRPALPINRSAIISVIATALTLISFCTAVAPIPFTGYLCYPAAVVFGLVALVSGITALARIQPGKEEGRTHAWIGIWVGSIAVVAAGCAITIGILLFPRVLALVQHYIK
jgi:hypothetical protein